MTVRLLERKRTRRIGIQFTLCSGPLPGGQGGVYMHNGRHSQWHLQFCLPFWPPVGYSLETEAVLPSSRWRKKCRGQREFPRGPADVPCMCPAHDHCRDLGGPRPVAFSLQPQVTRGNSRLTTVSSQTRPYPVAEAGPAPLQTMVRRGEVAGPAGFVRQSTTAAQLSSASGSVLRTRFVHGSTRCHVTAWPY